MSSTSTLHVTPREHSALHVLPTLSSSSLTVESSMSDVDEMLEAAYSDDVRKKHTISSILKVSRLSSAQAWSVKAL